VALTRAYVFKKSWSRSRLPLPLARVAAVFGEPLRPTLEDLKRPVSEQRALLEQGLADSTAAAETYLKNWYINC
jgi:lysophospholipid acyltransferase (LPLAT)-like uncharacterized protein